MAILTAVGTVLSGIVLYDVYADWMMEGKPLWSTLLENALPLALALAVPIGGWWLAKAEQGRTYLSSAAKWTLLGCVLTLIVAGITLGFQIIQREIKPFVFITQMMTAGAVAGLLVGCILVEMRRRQGGSLQEQIMEIVSEETGEEQEEGDKTESAIRQEAGAEPIPFGRMRLSKQVALGLLAVLGSTLAAVVLFDVYQDWILEGKPLWSTLAENAVPLLLALAVPLSGWQLARLKQAETYLSASAKWASAGTFGMLTMAGSVVGLQIVQGEFKPGIILTQMTTFGAVAGLFVGYSVARARRVWGELLDRQARLRALAHSVPGGLYRFEVAQKGGYEFTFISKQAEALLGVSSAPEGYFARLLDRVPDTHRARLRASMDTATSEEEPFDVEFPVDRPDGKRVWVRALFTPERKDADREDAGQNGTGTGSETLAYHGVVLDITDRRETERRYEAIFNQTYQFTGLMETDGTLVEANDTALEVGGLTEEEVLGKRVWETYWFQTDEETRERLRVATRRAAKGEFVRYEETVRAKDGTIVIDLSIRPLTNENGEVTMLIPEGRDITERKRRKNRLERQNDLFQKTQDLADVGAWEYDVHTDKLTWTRKVYEIHELPEGTEITPSRAVEFYHPEDRPVLRERFRRAVEKGEPYDLELRIQTGEGNERWVHAWAEPQAEDGEVVRVRGTFQDITRQKRREKALQEAKEKAEEASDLKSALLANMSHEFRTPLTSIIGFASTIETELEGEEGPASTFAARIQTSGERLMDTLNGVLHLARFESGTVDLSPEPIDASKKARTIAEQLRTEAEEEGVDLRADLPEDPLHARTDEEGLGIVLRNLASNAIKYTGGGGTVEVRARPEDEEVVLEVEDTGIGMDPDQVEGLFEAFQQGSTGVGREYEGSGLGLTVTRHVVHQMGGTIEVETAKEEGSRFTVRLPRGEPERPEDRS